MTRRFACQAFITADFVIDGDCGCDLDVNDADDEQLIEDMIDMGSDLICLLTGNLITGICTRTVRPVRLCDTPYISNHPVFSNQRRFGGLDTIPLRGPNVDIVEIVIDGVVINPSDYGLTDNLYLFRRSACWPTANDLRLASTEIGTWEITLRFGVDPDYLTRMATRELVCELIKDQKGRQHALPRGVTSASLQGVSVQVAQSRADALREGNEQLPILARFLSVYGDLAPGAQVGVWSPELEQSWNLVEVEGPSGS